MPPGEMRVRDVRRLNSDVVRGASTTVACYLSDEVSDEELRAPVYDGHFAWHDAHRTPPPALRDLVVE